MKNSPPAFILVSVAAIVVASAFADHNLLCCGNSSVLLHYGSYQCEDGQELLLPCNSNDVSYLGTRKEDHKTVDDETKMYENEQLTVYPPDFCVETDKWHSENVYGCRSRVIVKNRRAHRDLIAVITALLFLVSGIFLAITAAIYFYIPQTQDIEGKCTFHLTLNQSIMYVLGAYWCLKMDKDGTIMGEFCIGHWYLFIFTVLAFFVWSTVLAYHIRRRFRQNRRTDESKLMRWYLIIGYGIPALLVIAGYIFIYSYLSFAMGLFESSCSLHRRVMFILFAFLPILITQLTCAFFFVSLQRKLWSAQPANSPVHSISTMKKFKFRLSLNGKLFVLTGLPYLLIFLISLIADTLRMRSLETLFLVLGISIIEFMACEGIVIFYMLVISRKRILRGVAGKLGFTLPGMQPCPESEESIAYSNDNENELNRIL